jgi:hypothetical protein
MVKEKKIKKEQKNDKEDDIQKLRNKLADRKEQVRRLKHTIRELEKQLISEGKEKPKKDRKPKGIKKEQPIDTKRDILDKFKQLYSKKENNENPES